ncbi:hypothetical protein E2C01_002102 [Portunus trituberculatus]|uniref:Uncharacterized protein n=1 Tax=Portunus trituberculatus TaxID=210409 RepID=A0A5B7CJ00_PORTR|nr:hypothetical protein [Portunus trituberculatus]
MKSVLQEQILCHQRAAFPPISQPTTLHHSHSNTGAHQYSPRVRCSVGEPRKAGAADRQPSPGGSGGQDDSSSLPLTFTTTQPPPKPRHARYLSGGCANSAGLSPRHHPPPHLTLILGHYGVITSTCVSYPCPEGSPA